MYPPPGYSVDKCDAKVRKNFELIKPGFESHPSCEDLPASPSEHGASKAIVTGLNRRKRQLVASSCLVSSRFVVSF